jgi:hypothetical protein
LKKLVTFKVFSVTILFLLLSILFFFGNHEVIRADGTSQKAEIKPAGKGGEGYPEQGIHAGVWNEGQAAPWDLHLIDHFRYFGAYERARGYKPEQPIPFSHITHVKENQIDCQFCHWSVAKSSYAAIPEVENCMGCHNYIPGRTDEQKEGINKLKGYWDNSGIPYKTNEKGETVNFEGEKITKTGESAPIPWEKVHASPNYLKFNHKRHVAAGVSCHSCHGQIPEMEVVERVSSFKMGWCLDCHRQQGASIDCATCHY